MNVLMIAAYSVCDVEICLLSVHILSPSLVFVV